MINKEKIYEDIKKSTISTLTLFTIALLLLLQCSYFIQFTIPSLIDQQSQSYTSPNHLAPPVNTMIINEDGSNLGSRNAVINNTTISALSNSLVVTYIPAANPTLVPYNPTTPDTTILSQATNSNVKLYKEPANTATLSQSFSEITPDSAADVISSQPTLDSYWLHTNGSRIEFANGTQIILRGVVIEDPMLIKLDSYGEHHWGEQDFIELEQWHANVVHLVVHPDLYEQYPDYTEAYIDPVVNWSVAHGMYVMIDWMGHGNIITGKVNMNSVSKYYPFSNVRSIYDPNLTWSYRFFDDVAERYKDNPFVFYSVFNEPEYITWDEWRPQAEGLTDEIRLHNPRALVVVPGVANGYDLSGVARNPVNRPNIVYNTHPYVDRTGQTHGTWDSDFGYLTDKYPVIAGEWGFIENYPKSICANATLEGYGIPITSYMRQHNMSWTAFAFSKSWLPMLENEPGYQPTKFGQLVKDELQKDYESRIL